MTPQTYASADRLLAAIPVERRDRHRDRLYEHVAKLYQRERLRAATRILSDRDVALRDALAERVCTLTGVTQGQLMRRTRGGTYGPPSQGRRVLCLALFMAAPHLALHDVAALMGRPGRHANVIFWRDSATETERAMAQAVVNHWRSEQARRSA